MLITWGTVFAIAMGLAAIAIPLFKRVAAATGFLDHPAERKAHTHAVPYLGGLAILVGVATALTAGPGLGPRAGAIAFGACVLGAVGLIDDRYEVHALMRLSVQVAVALGTVAAGVSAHVTGLFWLDATITVVWIVGITNALNLMDNMDGLAGGTAFVTSVGAFAVAAAGGQTVVPTFAVAVAGASLGFLFFNVYRASIFMGDAGSLFLGYLLAVVALMVDPIVAPPPSLAVPILLLALPIADTSTVVIARLHNGRRVGQPGRDHLSHRIVAHGFTKIQAVAGLLAAQAVLGVVAVLVGIGAMSAPVGIAVGAVVLGLVVAAAATAQVYPPQVTRRLRARLLAVVGGLALAASGAVGLLSHPDVVAARTGVWSSSSSIDVEEPFTVRGSGFEPHETVRVRIDDLTLMAVTVGDNGEFRAEVAIPAGASVQAGMHQLRVIGSQREGAIQLAVRDGLAGDGFADAVPLRMLILGGVLLVAGTFVVLVHPLSSERVARLLTLRRPGEDAESA